MRAAASAERWSSSLKTGDVVRRGTVWTVTVSPTPDEVDFWASGSVIATDTSAPFEVPLDLAPGDYKLGFCHTTDGTETCETTETGAGTGIVARVTIAVGVAPADTTLLRCPCRAARRVCGTDERQRGLVSVHRRHGRHRIRRVSRLEPVGTTTQTNASFTGLTLR